jgi:hypothetical protein
MKRSPSASHSYLHRLAEPVPSHAALLTTQRPATLGQSVREAIPLILDSLSDPVTAFPAKRQRAPRATLMPQAQTTPSQSFAIDAANPPANRSARVARNAHALAQADNSTSFARDNGPTEQRRAALTADNLHPHSTNAEREDRAMASETFAARNNPSPGSENSRQKALLASANAEHLGSAASSRTEPIPVVRDQSSRIHIGSVEVRTASPPREPQPAPRIDRHANTGRSALAAEPLARPLAWSHGLVQG